MAVKVIFDGVTRLIDVKFGIVELDAQVDLYSDWKEWVKEGDNSKFLPAFRTAAGDVIGIGKAIAPYFFLLNGWEIRPHDANHTLLIEGNLYADPAENDIVEPSSGSYTVNAILERAVDAVSIITSGSGGGLTPGQEATLDSTYEATSVTTASLDEVIVSQSIADGKLDTIIAAGGALTPDQADMLLKLYEVMGLDPTQPLVVSPEARTVSSSISQSIDTSGRIVTVTRTV
jgi:hypothetical protein